jgi:hypothetical protein
MDVILSASTVLSCSTAGADDAELTGSCSDWSLTTVGIAAAEVTGS